MVVISDRNNSSQKIGGRLPTTNTVLARRVSSLPMTVRGLPIPVKEFLAINPRLHGNTFYPESQYPVKFIVDPSKPGDRIDPLSDPSTIRTNPAFIYGKTPDARAKNTNKDPHQLGVVSSCNQALMMYTLTERWTDATPTQEEISMFMSLLLGYLYFMSDTAVQGRMGGNGFASSTFYINSKGELSPARGLQRASDSIADLLFVQSLIRFGNKVNPASLRGPFQLDIASRLPDEQQKRFSDQKDPNFFKDLTAYFLGRIKSSYIRTVGSKSYLTVSEDLPVNIALPNYKNEYEEHLTIDLSVFHNDMLIEFAQFDRNDRNEWLSIRKNMFDLGKTTYQKLGYIPDQFDFSINDNDRISITPKKTMVNKSPLEGEYGMRFYIETAKTAVSPEPENIPSEYQIKPDSQQLLRQWRTDGRFSSKTQAAKGRAPYITPNYYAGFYYLLNYAHDRLFLPQNVAEWTHHIEKASGLKRTIMPQKTAFGGVEQLSRNSFNESMLLVPNFGALNRGPVSYAIQKYGKPILRSNTDLNNKALQTQNTLTLANDLISLLSNKDSSPKKVMDTCIAYALSLLDQSEGYNILLDLKNGFIPDLMLRGVMAHIQKTNPHFREWGVSRVGRSLSQGDFEGVVDQFSNFWNGDLPAINKVSSEYSTILAAHIELLSHDLGPNGSTDRQQQSRTSETYSQLLGGHIKKKETLTSIKTYQLMDHFTDVLLNAAQQGRAQRTTTGALLALDLLSALRGEYKPGKTAGMIRQSIGLLEGSISETGDYDALPEYIELLLERKDIFGESKEANVLLHLCLVRTLDNLRKSSAANASEGGHYRIASELMSCRNTLIQPFTGRIPRGNIVRLFNGYSKNDWKSFFVDPSKDELLLKPNGETLIKLSNLPPRLKDTLIALSRQCATTARQNIVDEANRLQNWSKGQTRIMAGVRFSNPIQPVEKQPYTGADQYISWVKELINYLNTTKFTNIAMYYLNIAMGSPPYENVDQSRLKIEFSKLSKLIAADHLSRLQEQTLKKSLIDDDQWAIDLMFIRQYGLLRNENMAELYVMKSQVLGNRAFADKNIDPTQPIIMIGGKAYESTGQLKQRFDAANLEIESLNMAIKNRQYWLEGKANVPLIQKQYRQLYKDVISHYSGKKINEIIDRVQDAKASTRQRMGALAAIWIGNHPEETTQQITWILANCKTSDPLLHILTKNFQTELAGDPIYASKLNQYELFMGSITLLAQAYSKKAAVLRDMLQRFENTPHYEAINREYKKTLLESRLINLLPSKFLNQNALNVKTNPIPYMRDNAIVKGDSYTTASSVYDRLFKEYRTLLPKQGTTNNVSWLDGSFRNSFSQRLDWLEDNLSNSAVTAQQAGRSGFNLQRLYKDTLIQRVNQFEDQYNDLTTLREKDTIANWTQLIDNLLLIDESDFEYTEKAMPMLTKWLGMLMNAYFRRALLNHKQEDKDKGLALASTFGNAAATFSYQYYFTGQPTIRVQYGDHRTADIKLTPNEDKAFRLFCRQEKDLSVAQHLKQQRTAEYLRNNSMLYKKDAVKYMLQARNALSSAQPNRMLQDMVYDLLSDLLKALPDDRDFYFDKIVLLAYDQTDRQNREKALDLIETYKSFFQDKEPGDYSQYLWFNLVDINLHLDDANDVLTNTGGQVTPAQRIHKEQAARALSSELGKLFPSKMLTYFAPNNSPNLTASNIKITLTSDKVLLYAYTMSAIGHILQACKTYFEHKLKDLELSDLDEQMKHYYQLALDLLAATKGQNDQIKNKNLPFIQFIQSNVGIFKDDWIKRKASTDTYTVNMQLVERNIATNLDYCRMTQDGFNDLASTGSLSTYAQYIHPFEDIVEIDRALVYQVRDDTTQDYIHSDDIAKTMLMAIKSNDVALAEKYYPTYQMLRKYGKAGLPAQLIMMYGGAQQVDETGKSLIDGGEPDIHACLLFAKALNSINRKADAQVLLNAVVAYERQHQGSLEVFSEYLDIPLIADCSRIDAANGAYWQAKAASATSVLSTLAHSTQGILPDYFHIKPEGNGAFSLDMTKPIAPNQGYHSFNVLVSLAKEEPMNNSTRESLGLLARNNYNRFNQQHFLLVEDADAKRMFPSLPEQQGIHSAVPYQTFKLISERLNLGLNFQPSLILQKKFLTSPTSPLPEMWIKLETLPPQQYIATPTAIIKPKSVAIIPAPPITTTIKPKKILQLSSTSNDNSNIGIAKSRSVLNKKITRVRVNPRPLRQKTTSLQDL